MHKQRLFTIIAAGVGLISIFLPWVSSPSMEIFGIRVPSMTAYGYQAWEGWVIFGMCLAAAALIYTQGDKEAEMDADLKKKILGIGGGIVGFLILAVFVRIGFGVLGFGTYLAFLAGVGVLAMPFIIKGDGTFEMPNKETIQADLNTNNPDSNDISSEE